MHGPHEPQEATQIPGDTLAVKHACCFSLWPHCWPRYCCRWRKLPGERSGLTKDGLSSGSPHGLSLQDSKTVHTCVSEVSSSPLHNLSQTPQCHGECGYFTCPWAEITHCPTTLISCDPFYDMGISPCLQPGRTCSTQTFQFHLAVFGVPASTT